MIVGALVSCTLAAIPLVDADSAQREAVRIPSKPRQANIVIAPAVTVSRANASRPHWEVQIAADPTDAKRLIACSSVLSAEQSYRASWPANVIVYTSSDGGLSWQPTLEVDKHQHNNDPSCTFGADGTAYFMSFGGNRGSKFRMPMYRSEDGAKTWSEVGEPEAEDRDYITIDDTGGKYHGRVYVHGVANGLGGIVAPGIDGGRLRGLAIFHSTDRGQTYGSVKLAEEAGQSISANGNGVVMSDGTFGAIFGDASDQTLVFTLHPQAPNAKLKFISSDDGGETFGKAVVVGDWYYRPNGNLYGMPSLAVDRTQGPFQNRLYAAWVDVRSGRGEIRFARSDDKGKTWFPSFVISDNWPHDERGETPDAFMPTLAVNRHGVLGVMWYDRRDHPDNQGYDIRFSASLDGGESFLTSVLISLGGDSPLRMKEWLLWPPWPVPPKPDGRQDAAFLPWGGSNYGGDTAGLTSDFDGVFHALWIDRLSGVQQISTTRITVNGVAMPNGGEGLESFHDISNKAEVRYSMAHVDLATNEITIGAAIANVSNERIPAQITLRLLALTSNSGLVEAQNADNGAAAGGAVWVFHTAAGEPLEPGALTLPRELRFKVAHAPYAPPRVAPGVWFTAGHHFLELATKLLGR